MDFLLLFVFLGAFAAGWAGYWLFLRLAERKALSLYRKAAAEKGNAVQKDNAEELLVFLAEVKEAWGEAKAEGLAPKEFALKVMPGLALKHPVLLMRYGNRLKKLVEGEGIDLSSFMAA